jgi:hypothetical protein
VDVGKEGAECTFDKLKAGAKAIVKKRLQILTLFSVKNITKKRHNKKILKITFN